MPDQSNPSRDLSEISHLFLSSIREKASNGGPAPRRKPPGQRDETPAELSAEEYAQVMGIEEAIGETAPAVRVPEVTAVIGTHLNGRQFDRVREYARHLTKAHGRIGLIEVDASEFRVMCFDSDQTPVQPEPPPTESFDPRRMTETLNELSADVDRWLLVLPAPRSPEARAILRQVNRWVLLCTADHDGVVAAYRALKGLTELWPASSGTAKPRLSLALLESADDGHAERIFTKLAAVCGQFLTWPVEAEPAVRPVVDSAEHLALSCRPMHDKTQVASAAQWEVTADLVARSKLSPLPEPDMNDSASEAVDDVYHLPRRSAAAKKFITDVVVPAPENGAAPRPAMQMAAAATDISGDSEVIDLPGGTGDEMILSAILRHRASDLIECPIAPPMCAGARLAVGRDRRVVLLAVARQGLSELPTISQAYRWLEENKSLIGMAVPQLAIDTAQPPQLSLFVDRSDSAAQTLRPILQSTHVTVQIYRTLRWSGRTGLLLDAA